MATREVIYHTDLMNFLGKGEKAARNLLKGIKDALGKSEKGVVTVREAAKYLEVDEIELRKFVK